MRTTQIESVLFGRPGPDCTERTLTLAHARARSLGLCTALVATTSGATARRAAEVLADLELIVVTHSTGFAAPNQQELLPEHRQALETAGARILTCQHALGGVNRAVRRKLESYQLDEIIAFTLRIFGQGTKVVAEMALMAADAGWVRTDQPVLAVAGTGRGADTAAILMPAHAQDFFELKILEIICRPAPQHPGLASCKTR